MATSLVTSDSLLAVDIGSVKTRALLFDVIDGRYRFLASGSGNTTIGPPYYDSGEGVRKAISNLSVVTGRTFLDKDENLITPTKPDSTGIDSFALTISAGIPLKVVAVGLVQEVSVRSARHLAETIFSKIVSTLSLDDQRSQEARIDTILKLRPDLIIIAGGIEGGESASISKLFEAVGLACYLLPKGLRPQIIFSGNQKMQKEVEESLGVLGGLHIAPNIRPSWEVESLAPAQKTLVDVFRKLRTGKSISLRELDSWSKGRMMPTSVAFGRIIRVLSKIYDPAKGVLGIDLGASSATIVSSFNGKSAIGVYPHFGMGQSVPEVLRRSKVEEITRWLPLDISPDEVMDFLHNKIIYPNSLPMTPEDLALEQAIIRQTLRTLVRRISYSFPENSSRTGSEILPLFEPIMIAGNAITKTPPGQCMLMLLDGLQPTGVTTILLDQNSLVSALGASAEINPILAVQVLGSNTVQNLGTVIAPVGSARVAAPILQGQITYADGRESMFEVKFGTIEVLPLTLGEKATLKLQPLHRFDIGMGPGRGGTLQVAGGTLGIVIDARGRPLPQPPDPAKRRGQFKQWLRILGN